jgi:hypothetical protein
MSNSKLPRFADPKERKDSLLSSDAEIRKQRRQWHQEDGENLVLLAVAFGIRRDDPDLFFKLSLELARKHYPIEKKRGREFVWSPWMEALVFVEITRLKQIRKKAKLAALYSELLEDPAWEKFIDHGRGSAAPENVVKKHYYAGGKHREAKILMKSYRFHSEFGALDEWKSLVYDFLQKPL